MLRSILFALCILSSVRAEPTPLAPPPRESKKFIVEHPVCYQGEVLAVDGQRSITIRGTGTGLPNEVIVIRTFHAGTALASGKQEYKERSNSDYRLTEVRTGDRVYIVIHREEHGDFCVAVRIERRPGGTVHPSPWQDPESKIKHHELMNAWQAFEEKGIPVPALYDPSKRNTDEADERDRQELKKHLERMRWERDHTAPKPRAVDRR